MNIAMTLLLLSALTLLPARAQDHVEPAPSSGQVAGHADEPGAHAEHEASVPTGSSARPAWAWPAILLLLAIGAATPVAARRGGRRLPLPAVIGTCVLAALAILVVTRPGAEAPGHEAGHDEHEGEPAESSPFVSVSAEAAKALGLRTVTVSPTEFASGLAATGRIMPVESREAHLGSRISGRLTAVRVKIGDRVAAGQVVATLDSVDAAQAAAAWREAGARLAAARSNLATRRKLVTSGAFTAEPVEGARRQLADARVEQAKADSELAQARNELDAATAELARTERLVAGGSFTTAAEEEARQRLAEAERNLAEARARVAEAEAAVSDAKGAVDLARQRVTGAESLAERTARLAATGELDRAPLEQAQNHLAEARARRQQAEAALEQAQRQARRGEELYRAELISLNDLEGRRSAVREREAEHQTSVTAVANAESALKRQEQIAATRLTSGRAEQEAQNTLAEARRELAAANARLTQSESRLGVVRTGLPPAQAATEAARSALLRERALAGDQTRAHTALAEARLRVAQAERAAQGKRGEVTEARGKVGVAEAALKREQSLAAGHVRGREQLLGAEAEVSAARIARDNAAEVLHLLGASTKAAGGSRGPVQVPIRSPLSGQVTEIDATVGEAISAEQSLMSVVDLSEVYVEADVYEKDLPRIQEGQAVQVAVRAFPNQPVLGSVVSISGRLDPETRAAHVRALLPNPDWRLRPEMFAAVRFTTEAGARALSVPAEAVQEVEGGPVVFVQRAPEQYEMRSVSLGRRDGERVEVTSGLKGGEVVVTAGSYLLKSQRLKGELGEGHAH